MTDSAASPDPFVPVVVSTSIHGASVLVDWDTVPGADGYDVEVRDGQGQPLDPPPVVVWGEDGSSAVLSGPAVASGASLRVRVRSMSSFSAPVVIPVVPLDAPGEPAVCVGIAEVQASWEAVAGAESYEAEVVDADGLPLYPQPTVRLAGTTAAIDAEPLRTGGAYGVRVRALAGTSTSAWGAAGTVRVYRVPPPSITGACYRGGAIDFTWSAVPGATRYLVQVLDAAGARLDPQPAVSGSNESAAVQGPGITGGVRVQLQVGVEITGQGSAWSDPLAMDLVDLAAPAGVAVSLGRDRAEVRWDAVPGAAAYRVEIADASGEPSPGLPAQTVEGSSASVAVDALAPGTEYRVRVTATAPHCEGPASEPLAFTRTVLPLPADLRGVYHAAERRVALSWSAVEGAAGYFVRLQMDGSTLPGSELSTPSPAAMPAVALAPGTAYVAQVRAARPDAEGDWASADVVALDLGAPQGLALSAAGDAIAAQWQPVEGAAGYEVRVLDADAEPWQPAPSVTVDGTTAAITAPGLEPSDYFEVRVRALAANVVGPWCGPAILRRDDAGAPTGVQAVYHSAARQVRVSWAPVPGADGYRVRLLDDAGRPFGTPAASALPRATLDAAALTHGRTYEAQVSATIGDDGPWSTETAELTVRDLAAPSAVRASLAGGEVQATWAPVDGAAAYDVRVDDADGRPVSPAPRVRQEDGGARIPASELGGQAFVELRVRATAPGVAGPWSAPAAVALAAVAAGAASPDAPVTSEPIAVPADTQAEAESTPPAIPGTAPESNPPPQEPQANAATSDASAADGDVGIDQPEPEPSDAPPAAVPGVMTVPDAPGESAQYPTPDPQASDPPASDLPAANSPASDPPAPVAVEDAPPVVPPATNGAAPAEPASPVLDAAPAPAGDVEPAPPPADVSVEEEEAVG